MKRYLAFFFLLTAILMLGLNSQTVQAENIPEFIQTDCDPALISSEADLAAVTCGTVRVPAFHAQPDGETINLSVIVLHARGENPSSEPLFMAQGGPGGSTIDAYTAALLAKPEILQERDVVLFDQRGTLFSDPELTCPETVDLTIDTIDQDLDDETSNQMYLDALETCKARWVEQGINLAAFNSLENAADIDWIRQALGYENIHFYGVSYGSLLGFHLLRTDPAWLRSAILDGIVPPDRNFLMDARQSEYRAFQLMFDTCKQNDACQKAYPNLEEDFLELVKRLNENPIHVDAVDMETFKEYSALVDGDTVVFLFHQLLYSSDMVVALPRTVYDLREGKTEFFGRMLGLVAFDRSMSEGMYYSVICAEDADIDFDQAQAKLEGLPEWISNGEVDDLKSIEGICRGWGSQDLNPLVDEVVETELPVLLLNGEMDPITPPAYGEHASQSLKNATNLVFPGMGHGQFVSNECATSISLDFLRDPTSNLDTSCVEKMGLPSYLTPSTVIDFPVVFQLLNLKPFALVTILLFLLLGFYLGLSWLILPVAWLVRHFQHRASNGPSSVLSRVSVALPGLSGLLMGIFAIGVGILSYQLIMANKAVIFFGFPMNAWPLFALLYIAAFLLLVVSFSTIQAWVKRWWSVWMRLYLTTLSLTGLAVVGIVLLWMVF